MNFFCVLGYMLLLSVIVYWLELVGGSFVVIGVLLVLYLCNLYVLIIYVNVCYFEVSKEGVELVWWFGGGFDFILFYLVDEDVVYWYCVVCDFCVLFGDDIYVCYKCWCDEYFYFKYCGEMCGVGGLFYDDFNEGSFECCFVLM